MRLSDFKILSFDCYGTLIDWEEGIITGLKPLTDRASVGLSRNEILQAHAYHESTQQRWTPARKYSDLLAIVYKRLAEQWQVTVSDAQCREYGQSVQNWPAMSDSAQALQYLKQHFKLVILSNVDNASFEHSKRKLQVEFDAVYSAEDIGSYKPADRNHEYMLEHLAHRGYRKQDILHTAESMFHDHVPAKRFDLASCWIYRRHNQEGFGATMNPGQLPEVDFRFNSMSDLVKAHQSEMT